MTTKKKTRRRKRAATVVEAAPVVETPAVAEEASTPAPVLVPTAPSLSLEEYKNLKMN